MKKLLLLLAILIATTDTAFAWSRKAFPGYKIQKGYIGRNRSGGYRAVGPHIKSKPNVYKFDNRNWKPSQGLYNKSYYK